MSAINEGSMDATAVEDVFEALRQRINALVALPHSQRKAIDHAEAEALAQHQAGTCHLSEWSCSHCEADAAAGASVGDVADTEQCLAGYFIAPDANDDLHIWRERGNYPVPVLARWDLRDDPEVWDILAGAIREQS